VICCDESNACREAHGKYGDYNQLSSFGFQEVKVNHGANEKVACHEHGDYIYSPGDQAFFELAYSG